MHREQLKSALDTVRRVRHDANSPLTVALGHLQLLVDEPERLDPEARDSVELVLSELRRLIEILSGLEQVRDTLRRVASADADPA
jgi:signal transduction histidine kinase